MSCERTFLKEKKEGYRKSEDVDDDSQNEQIRQKQTNYDGDDDVGLSAFRRNKTDY